MKKIKVLGICASPRKGNSEYLLKKALVAASDAGGNDVKTNIYYFKGKKFKPCVDCGGCQKTGICVIKDDYQELSKLWYDSDVIIYSVPVYHMGIPGQLKNFFDRLGQTLDGFSSKYTNESMIRPMKIIGNIVQGADLISGQESTLIQLINHTLLMQSLPVAGDLGECYIGCGGWTMGRGEERAIQDLVKANDYTALTVCAAAEHVGKRCTQMAKILLAGITSMEPELSKDPVYNYILSKSKGESDDDEIIF